MEILPDKEEVAIDAIPLAIKPPSIVDWKIHKEGKKTYYQIIKADGSSKMYLVFSHMLKSFDKEDLETLWKLVKAKHGSTRPEEGYKRVLWDDLKGRIVRIKRLLDDLRVTAAQLMLLVYKLLLLKDKTKTERVIVNGDAPTIASASACTKGPIPPKTVEQKLARKNELKAKITLLLAIPDEHLLSRSQNC
ncbi:hypothetical protein Tco_0607642 [Tanacetum coccineum]